MSEGTLPGRLRAFTAGAWHRAGLAWRRLLIPFQPRPTLKLEPYCGWFPGDGYSGVKVTATVSPPFLPPTTDRFSNDPLPDPDAIPRIEGVASTSVQASGIGREGAGGTMGRGRGRGGLYLFTDESGLVVDAFGADTPSTFTVRVVWSGGTLEKSLPVDCRRMPSWRRLFP
jgi:hypothetical protein